MSKFILIIKSSLFNLPTPMNISYMWNMGSILGLFLLIQIISGLLISFHYCPNTSLAFSSLIHIIQNISNGWIIHNIHMNGASIFFICMYTHIARGIFFSSFKMTYTWMIGSTIFILSMLTAFLGYVLPWGQMSFWGATVITNLASAIPYVGNQIVMWIWGGFSVNNATLNRFFSLHFILPFIIMLFMIIHLTFLHETGSSNPLGLMSDLNKIPFHIYFTFKDLQGFCLILMIFYFLIFQWPYLLSDPENFTQANPLSTPMHIQPEWYFLFAYAILRSIPNKLGGILALLSSILILFVLPLMYQTYPPSPFSIFNKFNFFILMFSFILLTWSGAQLIEYPYMQISQMLSIIYFLSFITMPMIKLLWSYNIYQISV